jgi:hypothetical protein
MAVSYLGIQHVARLSGHVTPGAPDKVRKMRVFQLVDQGVALAGRDQLKPQSKTPTLW